MLILSKITKRFGETIALVDLDLSVNERELLALVGPSGCGKTTAIRIVAGLETADHGFVSWKGREWSLLPPQSRNVAMVFQHYALYPHRSVRGNIEYPLRLARLSVGERRKRVANVAELLGIAPLLDRRPKNLSGGEAQRVALARALVREPTCFLLDEPLSNLDARNRASARAEIKKIQRNLGVTTVYVTHDQEEALSLGDRVGVMNKGRLEQVGAPDDLILRPANTFVAGFLGKPPMNLIPAVVTEVSGDNVHVRLDGLNLPDWMSLMRPSEVPSDGKVILGFRPEHIRFADTSVPATADCRLEGRVTLSERTYPDYIAHCETEVGTVLVKSAERPFEGSVTLILPLQSMHYFAQSTGKRIATEVD